jgi:hypothetical protein
LDLKKIDYRNNQPKYNGAPASEHLSRMDPLVQLVKELLEATDPKISVVECHTACDKPAANPAPPHPEADRPLDISTTDTVSLSDSQQLTGCSTGSELSKSRYPN